MIKLITILFCFFCFVSNAQIRPGYNGFNNIHGSVIIVVDRFSFSSTSKTCSGWTSVHCDPQSNGSPCTATAAGGTTLTSVSTSNYSGSGGHAAFDNLGTQSGVFFSDCSGTTNAVMYSSWINVLAYDHTKVQITLGALNTGKTYKLKFTGSTTNGTVNQRITGIRLEGSSLGTAQTYNPGSSGNPNTTDGVTFTGVAPNGSGQINVFFYTTGTQQGILSALTIENEN